MLLKSAVIAALAMGGAGTVVYVGTPPADATDRLSSPDEHPHPPKSKKRTNTGTKAKSETKAKAKSTPRSDSQQPEVRSVAGNAETVDAEPVEPKRSYIDRWRNTEETTDEAASEVETNKRKSGMRDKVKLSGVRNSNPKAADAMPTEDLPKTMTMTMPERNVEVEVTIDPEVEEREGDPKRVTVMRKRITMDLSDDIDGISERELTEMMRTLEKDINIKVLRRDEDTKLNDSGIWVFDSKDLSQDSVSQSDNHSHDLKSSEALSIAMEQAAKISNDELKDQAYLDIVEFANSHQNFDGAKAAMADITQQELRDTARARIAVAMAKSGHADDAFGMIDDVEIEELRDVMRLQVIESLILPQRSPHIPHR